MSSTITPGGEQTRVVGAEGGGTEVDLEAMSPVRQLALVLEDTVQALEELDTEIAALTAGYQATLLEMTDRRGSLATLAHRYQTAIGILTAAGPTDPTDAGPC